MLPVFVAASLLPQHDIYVTLNAILGIASMPRAIVPSQDSFSGHTSVQWLLSLLPIARMSKSGVALGGANSTLTKTPEVLALLYPLHQALMPTIGYLTTTSLLPAELQLFSVSLINVLLLSSSPQALILQALVWIGGLSLSVLCKHVLEREVALARIPSWRFHRGGNHTRLQMHTQRILKRLLEGQFGYATLFENTSDDSGSDEPQNHVAKQTKVRARGFTLTAGDTDKSLAKSRTAIPASAIDGIMQPWPTKIDVALNPNRAEAKRHRSSTLPSSTGSLRNNLPPHNKTVKHTLFPLMTSKDLRSLTKAEATTMKWLYALYTYTVVIIIIALPIRSYLGKHALHAQEPIGWALGYLFGDNTTFRSMVVDLGLEQWIRLPPGEYAPANIHGWVEEVRWQILGAANTRLLVCFHCICMIGLGLAIVFRLSALADVDTRRKVFHGMMVIMFLPTIFVDPTFIALAFTLVLAIFLLLDLFRASQLPPLSQPLTHFLAPYVDGRDHRGPVIVSHIFLLIGCSIPLWLSLASVERRGTSPWEGWEIPTRDLSMVSGVVCVGMGDAAASLIGRRFGRRRWCWSGGKSLEGSAAFAVAVILGLGLTRLWLLNGGWLGANGDSWPLFFCKSVIAASGASLTEAVLTGGNDNVIVPVILWLLVRGLGV